MAAQKVKSYLENHKIGALFEDLMAKVIKEMPTDPLSFLIQILQNMQEKKHPGKILSSVHGVQDANISLTGIPAPQRSHREPQVVLPGGGRTISNTWHSHDIERLRSSRVSFEDSSKRRDYDKPWQSGSRYAKLKEDHELRQSVRNSINKEKPGWNSDTRVPSHDFDEWIKYRQTEEEQYITSDSKGKERKPFYMGVKSWADTTATTDLTKSDFQDGLLRQPVARERESYHNNDDLDFLQPIRSKAVNFDDLSTMDSESSITTVVSTKNIKAKDQATERKKKLQNLLIGKFSSDVETVSSTNDGDSSDEAAEIYESADELEYEGVKNLQDQNRFRAKVKPSHRYSYERCNEDIKVKICGRCARVMTGDEASTIVGNFKSDAGTYVWDNRKSTIDPAYSIVTEDDDFESVSEVGKNGKKMPAWPIIYDAEADEATPRASIEKLSRGSTSLASKVKSSRKDSQFSSRSADEGNIKMRDHEMLFSGDPRAYQKQRAKKVGYLTDTETELGRKSLLSASSAFKPRSGRGWSVKSIGTDSEADAEDSDPMAGLLYKKASRSTKRYPR